MQQVSMTPHQTITPSSAANRSVGMDVRKQPFIASGLRHAPTAECRPDRVPPLTNGDPPPIMLWGEEV